MTFHRYVALGDSFTEGVGDPDPEPPQRPARLGGPGRRGARRPATDGLRLRQPRDPRPQAATRSSPSSSSRRWRSSPTWSRSTPAPTTSCGRASTSTPSAERYDAALARLAGDRRPARWCGRRSTPAARPSTAPCAAGSRSTTSWSARSPTGTAPTSSTSGGCASTATGATGTPTGCTWARPATSGWRSRCSTPSASRTPPRCRELPTGREPSRRAEQRRANLAWTRSFAVPWVHRRITGRSSRGRRSAPAAGTSAPIDVASRAAARWSGAHADVAQLVERDLPKVDVASSNLVIRSPPETPGTAGGLAAFPPASRASDRPARTTSMWFSGVSCL